MTRADERTRLPNGEALDDYTPYLLNRLMAEANATLEQQLRAQGLSFQNWRVLLVLSQKGPMMINRLVEDTVVPQSTLSRVLARMERDGLVRRDAVVGDSRAWAVSLTAAGREVFEAVFPLAEGVYRAMIRGVPAGELASFRQVLARMRANQGGR